MGIILYPVPRILRGGVCSPGDNVHNSTSKHERKTQCGRQKHYHSRQPRPELAQLSQGRLSAFLCCVTISSTTVFSVVSLLVIRGIPLRALGGVTVMVRLSRTPITVRL